MKSSKHYLPLMLSALLVMAGCSDDLFDGANRRDDGNRIQLSGEIDQLAVTRVNDNGFADGDVMGVYIVDYNGNTPGTLKVRGNRGDNVRHTFDEAGYKWNSAYDLYFKDKTTPIDVYGYYPFGNPESIDAYPFTVERDQSTMTEGGTMGGYEASDFLWGKVADVSPSTNVIRLPLTHRMANAWVTLVEGTGFAEGEWAQTEKVVQVANLVREATINLADGSVIPTGKVENTSTVPSKRGDEWRAIVVPQTVKAGATLFSITIGGLPYKFSKQVDFTYTASKMSNFSIKVDKKADTGRYHLSLISESITPWENDLVSHDATMKEYVIINSTAGHLKDAIVAANKDYTKLRNLKITGEINAVDYRFMRDQMKNIQYLNLKDVISWSQIETTGEEYKGVIPNGAFSLHPLLRITLPENLNYINSAAFVQCPNLSGNLTIPEGVTYIGDDAFRECTSLSGSLSLPSTLEYIGTEAFNFCSFTGELILPNKLKHIEIAAFAHNSGFSGNLILPENLETLGRAAFSGCCNLTGNLIIPQKIKNIPADAFLSSGLNGTLQLHDGITSIGDEAFGSSPLKGILVLPKNLTIIGNSAFSGCDFSGELKLPQTLVSIGDDAFAGNQRITGIIELPPELLSVGSRAFAYCRMIEGLIIPESVENIKTNAFSNCFGIGKIVCKGTMPPNVMSGAFDGVPKDNFTLEVPESSIVQYQTAQGWGEFKRIAAHHELVCRPSIACALNTTHKQTLTIDAEGEWELQSKPDWCELSQTGGNKKTEVTLTINAMGKGSADRTGEIVFKLKDKDYTHKCTVTQYDYEYGEDEYLTLQKATKGNRGGINLVILGDGYDAKNISDGDYLANIKQEVEYFFAIEPYKTYRQYFNVYTAFPLSTETGVGTVNTICYNRFNTSYTGGVGLTADYDKVFRYVLNAPTVTRDNLKETLIIIVPNSTDYGGICQMWEDGSAIAFCPLSTYGYPLDSRGVIQHEAGGHGFGKLGDEYIYHNAFIDFCTCTCCGHVSAFNWAKSLGWYDNLSLTGKIHEVPWSHLIYNEKYSNMVDIYEGGFKHSRGVFRSEQNSCMNNNIPYYNTISRESIVKRIKRYAGESYSFNDFVANDKIDVTVETRSATQGSHHTVRTYQMPPVIHKGSPLKNLKRSGVHRR